MKRIIIFVFLFTIFSMLGLSGSEHTASLQSTKSLFTFVQDVPSFDRIRGQGGKGGKRIGRGLPNEGEKKGPMSPDKVEHYLAIAKKVDPALAEQLGAMCEKDPEAFQRIIHRQGHRIGSLIRLRESDPELYEVKVAELTIDAEIYHLTESLNGKDVNSSVTQGKIAELKGLVRSKTKISIQAQRLYIQRLQDHLNALQERLSDTENRFELIVDSRVNQLLKAITKELDVTPQQSE
mgnify:CR=1 FL=1